MMLVMLVGSVLFIRQLWGWGGTLENPASRVREELRVRRAFAYIVLGGILWHCVGFAFWWKGSQSPRWEWG